MTVSRWRSAGLPCLLVGAVVACGGGERPTEAGHRILEQTQPVEAGSDSVFDGEAEWVLGSRAGPDILYEVSDALAISPSTILLSSGRGGYVWRFDRGDVEPRPLLEEGRGPQEVRQPGSFQRVAGDSVYLYDPGNRRALWLAPDGTILRSETVVDGLFSAVWPAPSGESERFLGTTYTQVTPGQREEGSTWIPTAVRAIHDGRSDSIFTAAGREVYVTESGGFVIPPLERHGAVVPTPGGFWYLSPEGLDAEHRDAEGALDVVVRWGEDELDVTPAEGRAIRAELVAGAAVGSERIRRSFEIVGPPERVPSFESAHLDPEGLLWVVRRAYRDGFRRFADILSTEGGWLRRVPLPAEGEVLDIGTDALVTLVQDSLGVEYVHVHGPHRGLGSAQDPPR